MRGLDGRHHCDHGGCFGDIAREGHDPARKAFGVPGQLGQFPLPAGRRGDDHAAARQLQGHRPADTRTGARDPGDLSLTEGMIHHGRRLTETSLTLTSPLPDV